MTRLKTGLVLVIYEAIIINIALIHLAFMSLYILLALLGPFGFLLIDRRLRHQPIGAAWIIFGALYFFSAALIGLLIPSLLL